MNANYRDGNDKAEQGGATMYQTIQVSSCVSVQGEFVEILADGQVVIRVGETEYRGRPILRRPIGLIVRPEVAAMQSASQPG